MLFEALPKQPDSFGIGYAAFQLQSKKAHEGKLVTNLVFDEVIGESVHFLQFNTLNMSTTSIEAPPVFRLPRGGVHATSFSFC